MGKPRILFLARFTNANAYTRYRVSQYLPYLREAGFECEVDTLFPAVYITRTYGGSSRRRALLHLAPRMVGWFARRIWFLLRARRKFDVVFLQYEAVPYLPLALERALLPRRARLVMDFDDAVHLNYEDHRSPIVRWLLGSKIAGLVSSSHAVITANQHLADWANRYNSKVTTITNAVDLRKYPVRRSNRDSAPEVVIGWIGTPVTTRFLRQIERPLKDLSKRYNFALKVIGAPHFTMNGVNVHAVAWSEATEVQELQACDIGIMPLPDDEWARGKSALKLIQYLAAGIAAVASPVGANCDVLSDGRDGLFAATEADWVQKIALLIEDPSYREGLAAEGRKTAESRFSIDTTAKHVLNVLRDAAMAEHGERGVRRT